jgi:hypothetical protein
MKIRSALSATLVASSLATASESVPPPQHWAWWAGDQAPLFDEALRVAGLDQTRFRFSPEVVGAWFGDKWRLPAFDLFFENPWNCSPYGKDMAATARKNAPGIQSLQVQAQVSAGVKVRDNFYSSAMKLYAGMAESDGPLALAKALEAAGAGKAEEIARDASYAKIPEAASTSAALILRVLRDTLAFHKISVIDPLKNAGLEPAEVYELMYGDLFWGPDSDDDAVLPNDVRFAEVSRMMKMEKMVDAVDFPLMARGGNLLAMVVDDANQRLHNAKKEGKTAFDGDFVVNTPYGRVRIAGTADHQHNADDQHDLLTIDLGGNDRYFRGAASGNPERHPVSVIIDVDGDDLYETKGTAAWLERLEKGPRGHEPGFRQEIRSEHFPAFGAGLLGYGYLADLAGNDRYFSPVGGLGYGSIGLGALVDVKGNDTYRGDTGVLGVGIFGFGTYADLEGDDQHDVLQKSLGYGGTLGAGTAVNLGGNDRYTADVKNVKYTWFNNLEPGNINLSMSLGFGFGRRADMSDGHSWAGGIGMLVDGGKGNDVYSCGIYGIGSSYWYALGLHHDDGGNDDYTSDSYSIASPPHFTVGIVINDEGNDVWRGRSSRACGFGRDFSIGWFEEGGGNDVYLCSDSAFGIGNLNSLAVCWDKGGDDVWIARSNSFGQPYMESENNIRDLPVNCGLFIDAGGNDRYLKLPEGMSSFDVDPKGPFEFEPWDVIRDGGTKSWRNHVPWPESKLKIPQPGSTGAAIDRD